MASDNHKIKDAATPADTEPLSNDNLPAAFWDALPEDGNNPDLLAIKALQEESTPEERAVTLKEQGNELFQRGVQLKKRYYLQQALEKYSEGITLLGEQHSGLASTLYSNRAQAHLRLANNRNALNDALTGLAMSPSNIKAAFRGATAAIRLRELDKSAEICGQGLAADPTAAELLQLSKEVASLQKAAKNTEERVAAQQLAIRAPAKKLALAFAKRGWRVGAPQVSVGSRKPYLGEDGLVHWPLLFMYPQAMQNDVVEDACETDILEDHLDAMFAYDAPPLPWDSEQAYTRSSIELYYISNAATPLPIDKLTEALHSGWPDDVAEREPQRYGNKAARAVRLKESDTLQGILQRPDYVVPGLPVFFILARGTEYRQTFLENLK